MNPSAKPSKNVLLVVSNPAVSTTTGWPVGFWASELMHPWFAFTEAGYAVTISSPGGGKVELDSWSDPRDASGYSAHDLISMGFINTPRLAALLNDTVKVSDQKAGDYDAIVVCGGQGPMFTYKDATALHGLFLEFYRAGKISAALCHGTCLLLYLKNDDATPFVLGKTMTGFANSEEDYADKFVGQKIMPFRVEDEAKKLGANFLVIGQFQPFALRDGNLITGQQQESARETARLVIEALGR
jgi:putative intracellular protease/amidase